MKAVHFVFESGLCLSPSSGQVSALSIWATLTSKASEASPGWFSQPVAQCCPIANCLMLPNFSRFAGLLMFGSYSVCNIIVLLNMLIAMMSNSYQVIFEILKSDFFTVFFLQLQIIMERSDVEWKFSRSKVWKRTAIK